MSTTRSHLIRLVALFAAIFVVHGPAFTAQRNDNPIEWSARVKKSASPLKPGSIFAVQVTATIADGWHLYSMDQMEGGPTATGLIVPDGQPFALDGEVKEPQPIIEFDPNFNLETHYFENNVTFNMSIKVAASAPPGTNTVRIDARYQTCNDRTCLPQGPCISRRRCRSQAPSGPANRPLHHRSFHQSGRGPAFIWHGKRHIAEPSS